MPPDTAGSAGQDRIHNSAATEPAGDETWLIPLLTEASAACHGNLDVMALRSALKCVPEDICQLAGILWAASSFDDDSPTLAQVAKWQSGNGPVKPPARLVITPKKGPSDA